MKNLTIRTLAILSITALFSTLLMSCGGGGGGGSDTPININACGDIGLTAKRATAKIINGVQCKENNSPIALLLLTSGNTNYLCSGALIAPNVVLTAAHCFTTQRIDRVSVSVGSEATSGVQVIIHPEAKDTDTAYFNDAALVKLEFPLSSPPLPILTSQAVQENDQIAIYGYGLDSDDNQGVLNSGRMVVDNVTSNHIAATYYKEESDPCFGDSGGPAVFTYSSAAGVLYGIVGIVSTGTSQDCSSGDYNLFTNVQQPQIYNFITQNVPNVVVR